MYEKQHSGPAGLGLPLAGARWARLGATQGCPGRDMPGRDEPLQARVAVGRRRRVVARLDRG